MNRYLTKKCAILTFLGAAIFVRITACAQNAVPEIGKPMPDFTLTNLHNYKASSVSLKDFKGKWLFMDFWMTSCASCIKSFPKANALQAQFKSSVQFLPVGINEEKAHFGKGIESLYSKLEKKQNLDLAVAFDSVLCRKWSIWGVPYIIIVDPDGIVKAITTGYDMTSEKIQALLDGRDVTFDTGRSVDPPFDATKISGSNLIYRSLLTKWNGEKQFVQDLDDFVAAGTKYEFLVARTPLRGLYNLAFFGKWQWVSRDPFYKEIYPHPILEMKDTSTFTFDYSTGKGIYNYELTVPRKYNTADQIMAIMQRELQNMLGYTATVEQRPVPVWKLIAEPGAAQKLKTKAAAHYFSDQSASGGAAGFVLRKASVDLLLTLITKYIDDHSMPFFDETHIKHDIDITIDALMTDREQVFAALRKNGLALVKGEKLMKVLVIRESNDNSKNK